MERGYADKFAIQEMGNRDFKEIITQTGVGL